MDQRDLNPASRPLAAPSGPFVVSSLAGPGDGAEPDVRRSIHGNRVHVAAATEVKPSRPAEVTIGIVEHGDRPKDRPRSMSTGLAAAALVALALIVVSHAASRWREEVRASASRERPWQEVASTAAPELLAPTGPGPVAKLGARVVRDDDGRIVAVHGSSPEAVLTAWGEADASIDPGSLEVAHSVPDRPTLRVGLWRSAHGLRAIQIFRQHTGSYWVTGDGRHPVPVFDPARLSFGPPTRLQSRG